MKAAVYCITLNEEKFVDRMINSALDADEILICDTGSTDGTVDLLKAWAAREPKVRWLPISVKPWRFDLPRNTALTLLSPDIDACIALDLDEVLTPNWRADIEKVWTPTTTRLRYNYIWSWRAPNVPDVSFWTDKIHHRQGYRWKHPVHETLYPYLSDEVYANASSGGLEIHHHPDHEKSRGQYLKLLELACHEDPEDDRTAYYLGREYFFHAHWEAAVVELGRHRGLKRATWNEERAASFRYSGKSLMQLGRHGEALAAFSHATQEAPQMRETWLDLAWFHYCVQDWQPCYDTCHEALKIVLRTHSYIGENDAYGARPYDLLSVAAWHLGRKDESIDAMRKALDFEPDNPRFLENLAMMTGITPD